VGYAVAAYGRSVVAGVPNAGEVLVIDPSDAAEERVRSLAPTWSVKRVARTLAEYVGDV
jgi:hypothetical protein